jgi:hypothetical protein
MPFPDEHGVRRSHLREGAVSSGTGNPWPKKVYEICRRSIESASSEGIDFHVVLEHAKR